MCRRVFTIRSRLFFCLFAIVLQAMLSDTYPCANFPCSVIPPTAWKQKRTCLCMMSLHGSFPLISHHLHTHSSISIPDIHLRHYHPLFLLSTCNVLGAWRSRFFCFTSFYLFGAYEELSRLHILSCLYIEYLAEKVFPELVP